MSKCCAPPKPSQKQNCPSCSKAAKPISYETVLHHVKFPACLDIEEAEFYFCESKSCDIVYFQANKISFELSDVREVVGRKSDKIDRPICYCFGVNASDVILELEESGKSVSKQKVTQLTKDKFCDCAIRNPAGSCCLVDFKGIENEFKVS